MKNGSMSFYSRWMFDSVTSEAAAGTAMGMMGIIGGVPTAAGMLVAWPIANKLGKQRSVMLGLSFSLIGGAISFIDVHNFSTVCIGSMLKGIGSIPAMYVTLALLSDVLDHLEARFGFRCDGVSMSVYTSVMTAVNGLAVAFFMFFYDNVAFDSSGVAAFFFVGYEIIAHAILIVLLFFLKVEKTIQQEQETIANRKKIEVNASGGIEQ